MTTVSDRGWFQRLVAQEDLNFLLTNRVPRIALTKLMGRFSRIESPWLTRVSIAVWRCFTPLDLSEAKLTRFRSLKDCFTRELKPGSRVFDGRPEILCSPSDGIVGACGHVERGQVYQAKGFPYSTAELFGPSQDASIFEGGRFITLRLTSAMYHRFHAPADATVEHVTYLSGDTWNVNPIALQRVERLFCRNERAVVRMRLASGEPIALVPVAAILVASIRLHFLDVLLHLGRKGAERDALLGKANQGAGDGLVRAWLDHHRFCAAGLRAGRGHCTGRAIARRPSAVETGLIRSPYPAPPPGPLRAPAQAA